MKLDDLLELSWIMLKYVQEEWRIFTPKLSPMEMTPSQLNAYRELKNMAVERKTKAMQLAELYARLEILKTYDDNPKFSEVIEAFEDTIYRFRRQER